MEKISKIIKFKPAIKPKPKRYQWQDLALEIINSLYDGQNKKSSIFMLCKNNPRIAKIAWLESKELNVLKTAYFFKVYSNIKKTYESHSNENSQQKTVS